MQFWEGVFRRGVNGAQEGRRRGGGEGADAVLGGRVFRRGVNGTQEGGGREGGGGGRKRALMQFWEGGGFRRGVNGAQEGRRRGGEGADAVLGGGGGFRRGVNGAQEGGGREGGRKRALIQFWEEEGVQGRGERCTGREKRGGGRGSLFAGCLTSQQRASVPQGRICSDDSTC